MRKASDIAILCLVTGALMGKTADKNENTKHKCALKYNCCFIVSACVRRLLTPNNQLEPLTSNNNTLQ